MAVFADNLRYLRSKKQFSQQKIADALHISRGQYQKYEDGVSEAPYQVLVRMSHYYNVTTDLLLTADLKKVTIENMIAVGKNRMLLPITVDAQNNDTIEVVTQTAKAGYRSGYADSEYIGTLPQLSLPFLGSGKHRAFPVDGDSMPPHENGSLIVGKYVEKMGDILDGKTYIVVTKEDGIVYKRLNKNGKNSLVLNSDNSFYESFTVKVSDILEIWEYVCNIGRSDRLTDVAPDNLTTMLLQMQQDLREVKSKLKD